MPGESLSHALAVDLAVRIPVVYKLMFDYSSSLARDTSLSTSSLRYLFFLWWLDSAAPPNALPLREGLKSIWASAQPDSIMTFLIQLCTPLS